MYYILFNPKAGGNTGEEKARKLDEILAGQQLNYLSVLDIKDYKVCPDRVSRSKPQSCLR